MTTTYIYLCLVFFFFRFLFALRTGFCNTESFPRIFDRPDGKQFDYVINCGGESRISQPEDVYRLRSHALSVALGKEAARRNITAFIECSTASVYKGDRTPQNENTEAKPITKLAKWKLAAENDLRKIPGLNLCVLRFAVVYGDYDAGYLSTPICLGRVYTTLDKSLTFHNSAEQPMNTVYVKDAARAIWTAAQWRANKGDLSGSSVPIVFNIVDHNNTTKGFFANSIAKTFSIETSFLGSMMTQLAKLNIDEVFDEMNEEALEIWAELLSNKSIERPGPLSPFLEKGVLKDTDFAIDGSLFEQTTGFKYETEKVPDDWIGSIVKSYERMGWWP